MEVYAIVLIVFGSVAALSLLLLFLIFKCRNKQQQQNPTAITQNGQATPVNDEPAVRGTGTSIEREKESDMVILAGAKRAGGFTATVGNQRSGRPGRDHNPRADGVKERQKESGVGGGADIGLNRSGAGGNALPMMMMGSATPEVVSGGGNVSSGGGGESSGCGSGGGGGGGESGVSGGGGGGENCGGGFGGGGGESGGGGFGGGGGESGGGGVGGGGF